MIRSLPMHILLNGLDVLVISVLFRLCLTIRPNVQWWVRIVLFFCAWATQVLVSAQFMYQAYTGMLYSILIIFLAARVLYRNTVKEIGFMTLLLGMFFFISEVSAYGLFSLAGIGTAFYFDHGLLMILSVSSRVFCLCIVAGFCLLYLRYGLYHVKAERGFVALTILLPVPLLICYLTLRYSPYASVTVSTLFWICFICLLLALYYVILLLVKLIQNHKYAVFEEMSERMCSRLEKEIDDMSSFRHDFRYHLRMMQSKDQEYTEELEAEAPLRMIHTGCFILDQMIADEMAQHPEIAIEVTGKLPKVLPNMKAVHLVSLFGNMLENAVHAVMDLEDEKEIRLYTDFDGYSMLLQMENAFANDGVKTGGQGLGLKNMRLITRQYNGMVEINKKEGWFTIKVLLQLDQEEGNE